MQRQIHKRLPKDFVKDLLKTFCAGEIAREQVCELLGLSRAQLYRWKEKYLTSTKRGRNSNSTVEKVSLLDPSLQG